MRGKRRAFLSGWRRRRPRRIKTEQIRRGAEPAYRQPARRQGPGDDAEQLEPPAPGRGEAEDKDEANPSSSLPRKRRVQARYLYKRSTAPAANGEQIKECQLDLYADDLDRHQRANQRSEVRLDGLCALCALRRIGHITTIAKATCGTIRLKHQDRRPRAGECPPHQGRAKSACSGPAWGCAATRLAAAKSRARPPTRAAKRVTRAASPRGKNKHATRYVQAPLARRGEQGRKKRKTRRRYYSYSPWLRSTAPHRAVPA